MYLHHHFTYVHWIIVESKAFTAHHITSRRPCSVLTSFDNKAGLTD